MSKDTIIVRGGNRLVGHVKVHGAKNAVLPIIAAALLGEDQPSFIHEVPLLDDVHTITQVLETLGVPAVYENGSLHVDARTITALEAPYELVRKMRASFLVMGPLLARMGRARIALPGGCEIGARPIDLHLKGFEAMGAKVSLGQGYIEASIEGRLQGAHIYLDMPSVGATENIMMAAVLAEGVTTLENAAREPEIVDLANYLNTMGAKVRGAGTNIIRITGVEKLTGGTHYVIPDRIEAGTFMVAAAITNGDVFVEGAIEEHLKPVVAKLREMGVTIEPSDNGIRVHVAEGTKLQAVDFKTLPHPGFPTDMQAQMMALLLVSQGTGIITETIFENRFMHVNEFLRLNANIKVEERSAFVTGGKPLSGAHVQATDLRAGAAMILAGLTIDDETHVTGLHHVDRGYVDLVGKLAGLGANIRRVSPEPEGDQTKSDQTKKAVHQNIA
jgi:UDP-N-acetylglucosamine 1-carboxyvinyltransferase